MENLSSLEYKTQEEILTVLKSLISTLSTIGCQVAEILFPSHLLNDFRNSLQSQSLKVSRISAPFPDCFINQSI